MLSIKRVESVLDHGINSSHFFAPEELASGIRHSISTDTHILNNEEIRNSWLQTSRNFIDNPSWNKEFAGHLKSYHLPMKDDEDAPKDECMTTSTVRIMALNSVVSSYTLNMHTNNENVVIAPNVSKLSASSVVEVRLQSLTDCVVVSCSADILKMRSAFFEHVLCEQEEDLHSMSSQSVMAGRWRPPITIPETVPYEAAAFLESLHEGRALFKGEWNGAWARLSVVWGVREYMLDYSGQIEGHVGGLLALTRSRHWRCNPGVLVGFRVALFRKTSAALPCILCGVAVKPSSSTAYSRLRIAFDAPEDDDPSSEAAHAVEDVSVSPEDQVRPESRVVIGDVSLPFWVQPPGGGDWTDPDELFLQEVEGHVTLTDKQTFWEMARAVVEHPELTQDVDIAIKDADSLVHTLKGLEFRFLWMEEAVNALQTSVLRQFVREAYVPGLPADRGAVALL